MSQPHRLRICFVNGLFCICTGIISHDQKQTLSFLKQNRDFIRSPIQYPYSVLARSSFLFFSRVNFNTAKVSILNLGYSRKRSAA